MPISVRIEIPYKIVKTVLYYAGHIMAAYSEGSIVDVFKVNGPLIQSLNLQNVV